MNDKLNGRSIYNPRNRDPHEDLILLVDAIASSDADLFAQGSSIVWLKDSGELMEVGRGALLELIAKYVVTKHLVKHGERWKSEYHPHVPDEMTLRALLMGEGGLAQRLPRAPGEPAGLTPRQQQEVQARLKIGEPKTKLAAEYGVSVAAIQQMMG
jgi:hypothetical protein